MEQLRDKHDKLRKLSRNLAVVKMIEEEWPVKSYEEIGKEFNICRERVRQIKKQMDARKQKLEAAALPTAA